MAQPGAPRGEVGTVTQGNVAPNALLRTGQWSTFIEQAEHVPELRWPQSVEWYDRMLRTDSRIESGYMSLTQPLWDFVYAIEPNGAPATYVKALAGDLGLPVGMPDPSEDDDYEIPAGGYGFSFVDHLIEALLAPAFGHYYFETVGVIDGDMWHLTELSPRAPRTIMSIYAMPTGQLIGIRQNIIPFPTNLLSASGVNLASPPLIESERLAAYIWRGDAGAKWIGRPMLRSLYRHWLVKDTLIRVDAINHERAGGVPGVETDQTWQGGDLGELKDAAAAFRVGEDAGYALPPGARMVLQRVGGTDVIGSIKYHDEQLGAQWEDQVGQLGQTLTGGNRALGQTFAGLQALARTAVARWFAATFRQQVIAKWWAFNVPMGAQGAQPKLPRLVFRPRREITGGLVQAVPVPPTEGGPLPEGGVPGQPGGQEPATGPPPVAAAGHPSPRASRPRSTEREGEAGRAGRGGVGDVRGDSSGAAQAGGSGGAQAEAPPLDAPRVRLPTNRPLRRQPYDFEVRAAVDFATIETTFQDVLAAVHGAFYAEWLPQMSAQLHDAITTTRAGTERVRVTAADMAKLRAQPVGQDALAAHLAVAARDGARAAQAELAAQGVEAPNPTDEALLAAVADHSAAVAQQTADGLSLAASRKAVQVSAGRSAPEVAREVSAYLGGLKHQWERDQLAGAVQQAQNAGRYAVYAPLEPRLKFYASELLDNATCTPCAGVDGTQYNSLDEAQQDYPGGGYVDCAGGPRCRGTLVGVSGDEV
jgi:hypothetical protein